jgi:hypothetical protein
MILQRDKNRTGQSPIDDSGNAARFDWFEGKRNAFIKMDM